MLLYWSSARRMCLGTPAIKQEQEDCVFVLDLNNGSSSLEAKRFVRKGRENHGSRASVESRGSINSINSLQPCSSHLVPRGCYRPSHNIIPAGSAASVLHQRFPLKHLNDFELSFGGRRNKQKLLLGIYILSGERCRAAGGSFCRSEPV